MTKVQNALGEKQRNVSDDSSVDSQKVLDATLKSPWRSMYISIAMQFVVGVQISIYFMSMWPYLSGLDKTVAMDFLGWVVASCSLGCSLANPLFGLWNQKTMAVARPAAAGMILAGIGQLLYGLLPYFSEHTKWIMMAARFITGFGAGSMSVLRAYLSMASVQKDRQRAISFGIAGFVLGLSIGPVIQACFTPLGEAGFWIGPILFNTYTTPAFVMFILSIVSAITLLSIFKEEYPGLAKKGDDEEHLVVPSFDLVPALICIYMWIIVNMIAVNIEVISTPLSTAMFNWKDSESVLYNSLLQALSCLASVSINFAIGYTRLGKIEKRSQILFGLTIFFLYHLFNYPWAFYSGPLDYIPVGNTSAEMGGCSPSFEWCADTVRVPMPLYIFCYVFFFGIAFPFITSPAGTLFSEVLGPRKQGSMQGMYSFGGSIAQFIAPIISTFLFERTGYKYVMVMQMCTIGFGLALMLVFYRRLVPLKMKPRLGESAKYKLGVFYAL